MVLKNKVYVRILDSVKIDEMSLWCYENISTSHIVWDWVYVDDSDLNSDVYFYFLHEKDAVVFSLRWL